MKHRAYSMLEIKSVKDDQRIITGIATTPTPDRVGDIVEPLGVKFKNPLPLLWRHRSDLPVGTVKFDKPTKDGISFTATLPKIDEPPSLKDRVDTAWGEIKAGLTRGVSIGFREIEFSRLEGGGLRFIETEVLELSLVTVPANQDAGIEVIKSIDDAYLLAATGREERKPASDMARKTVKIIAQEGNVKTIAERIKDFENTRAAKIARMEEIQGKASEAGRSKDDAEREEFKTLSGEIKSIDEEILDLQDMAKLNVTKAVPAVGDTEKAATSSRAGVRVEGVKANLPVGVPFTRFALALARSGGNRMEALAIAQNNKQWHDQTPEVEEVLKAAVAAGTTTDTTWAAPLVQYQIMASEFIEYLRPLTIIGRIPGLRRVPFKIKVPRQTAVASVNWVGEGKPKPVGKSAFDTVSLDHTKIAGIIVLTDELVRLSTPSAEALARDDLASGIVQLMDQDFIDPDKAAVAAVSPASIINGVVPVTASGTAYSNFVTDVKAVMQKFMDANISPDGVVVIMRQDLALALSLMVTSLGNPQFPGLTMNGGTLAGFTVVTSQNVQYTEDSPQEGSPIIFVRAPDIMLADDGAVTIDISREASLEMADPPTDTVSASTVLVSLFQHNMVGIRAERMVNWVKRRAAAAQFIAAAKYA
jgi:HK97 family phage major capsid protein/HK97 family phage prohead protease